MSVCANRLANVIGFALEVALGLVEAGKVRAIESAQTQYDYILICRYDLGCDTP